MVDPQMAKLFRGFAQELDSLAEGIDGLGDLVATTVEEADEAGRVDAMRRAQSIDEMSQRCRALAVLAVGVAQARPIEETFDEIPLADLAGRLRRALDLDVAAAHPRPDAGDLMLFD